MADGVGVGDDVFRRDAGKACAGARIERAQQADGLAGGIRVDAQRCRQTLGPESRQRLQMLARDAPGERHYRCRIALRELHQQAFGQAARAHAERVEALDAVQHGFHLVRFDHKIGAQPLEQRVEGFSQVAVFAYGLDQGHRDGAVARRHRRQVELPKQVVLQVPLAV